MPSGAARARKITNAGNRKVIGKFPSLKMNAVIWWESQLERDYIYLLEIDPEVLSYGEQPFTISYTDKGKPRRYTPDFVVTRPKKTQVVEVKPSNQAQTEKNLNLFRKIAPICTANNQEFVVVTELRIRVQPRLNNIKLLYKYARVPLSLSNYLDCLQYFHSTEPIRLLNAERDLKERGINRSLLLRLLWCGFLVTDLMQPLNAESLIQLSKETPTWERLKIQ